MTAETDRGLWELTRLDGAVLMRFRRSGVIPLYTMAQAFPRPLLFTLAPGGGATLVIPAEDAETGLPRLPGAAAEIRPAISVIRTTGDGMSAADHRARHIWERLAEEGIPVHAIALSDIGAAFAVDTVLAGRATDLIRAEFLFPG